VCDKFGVDRTPTLKAFAHGRDLLTYRADVYHEDLLLPFVRKLAAEQDQPEGAT
jgi:hypothetical protein